MVDKIRGVSLLKTDLPTYLLEGSFTVNGEFARGSCKIPFATLEKPLIPSINRGRKVINLAGGAQVKILKDEMTRAPFFVTDKPADLESFISNNYALLERIVNSTTSYGALTSLETEIFHNTLYLRLGMFCGDSAGHNMAEKAANAVARYLQAEFPGLKYCLSSNYCTDKKPALVNIEKGRGKLAAAKVILPEQIITKHLKTSGRELEDLNKRKNLWGSELAGSLGRNAHHANIVAAVYAATGQDLGNVVEGSLGETYIECRGGETVFEVKTPCLIVGTVGGGTYLAKDKLELMGCYGSGNPVGSNAKKLAELISVAVLAGELSLMASLTKEDELLKAHLCYERAGD